jgi:hypothetical protein
MSTFTQRVIEFAIRLLEYALTLPVESSRASILTAIAKTLIDYAISVDPAPDIPAEAEALRAELKASEESLADAVKQNQPS